MEFETRELKAGKDVKWKYKKSKWTIHIDLITGIDYAYHENGRVRNLTRKERRVYGSNL